MPINVGILGFGRIGAEHAGWLSSADGIRGIAASDPTPARRELAEKRGLRAFADFDMLMADPAIDAILIATPSAMHFDHASKAIAAGKHVMIEKPTALDLPQAQKLVSDAESRNLTLSVFHNRRWDVDYLTVKAAIAEQRFGKLINIESRISQWASCVGPAAREWRPNWRNESAFGGGGLYDWGSHLIDQIWRLLSPSKPERVFAQLRGNVWSNDCDDFARVCIDFDNGAVGLVEINTTTTAPLPRWHVDGTLGSAVGPMSPTYDTHDWARLQFTSAGGKTSELIKKAPAGLSEAQIWEQFARAIREGSDPAVTARSVLPTMCLLDAARESSRAGIAIDLRDRISWEI